MNHDHIKRRCPRLGDIISFSYCRACEEDGRPCPKALDCWWEHFDVVGYFRRTLSAEAFDRLSTSRPPEKITSLVDLIQQARKRCKS
jgi:hypothetical protein